MDMENYGTSPWQYNWLMYKNYYWGFIDYKTLEIITNKKWKSKTAVAYAAHLSALSKAEFLTDDKMTHLICSAYFW